MESALVWNQMQFWFDKIISRGGFDNVMHKMLSAVVLASELCCITQMPGAASELGLIYKSSIRLLTILDKTD